MPPYPVPAYGANRRRLALLAAASLLTCFRAPQPRVYGSGPAVVFLGDSLSAGAGVRPEEAFPALIAERLRSEGIAGAVLNAGIGGDTTAGGLTRVEPLLRGDVRVLVVELGGNDGLQRQPVEAMRGNLLRILEKARTANVPVLLTGMKLPLRYDAAYRSAFERVYAELGERPGVTLLPFLLEGVGGVARLNQPDGIHPTAEGHRIIAEVVWAALKPLVSPRR
jgi:acyl-CoA thioesterase-1